MIDNLFLFSHSTLVLTTTVLYNEKSNQFNPIQGDVILEYAQPSSQAEILLVDDTPEHIETAVAVLRTNFKIRIATKGSTAFKLIEQHPPDLILLDVYLPESNGFEICRMLKADKRYEGIPVIFLTSSNDEDSIQKGFALGAQDYVTKPFNTSELLARVTTHMKLKRQTESLKQANRELDSFCYTVAHDLKAPLLSLGKLTEYFCADYAPVLDGDGRELLTNIQEKAREMIHIVERLLEFSKMCEAKMNVQDLDLEKQFLAVYQELHALEPDRNVQFILGPLPHIQGDPLMIKLLLTNILANALKYSGKKETAVIEVAAVENETEYIISIQDNGAGFDMRYASRLFGVFQRLHSNSEFEGSGVGLAIAQKILKRHNGKASLTGMVERGATFSFSIPKSWSS